MNADQAYAACDPMNLDFTPVDPDQDRINAVEAKLKAAEKTMATPRYAIYFNRYAAALKRRVEQQIGWARDHIRRNGQSDEGGDYTIDAAEFFAGNIAEEVQMIVDRVEDLISDAYD